MDEQLFLEILWIRNYAYVTHVQIYAFKEIRFIGAVI